MYFECRACLKNVEDVTHSGLALIKSEDVANHHEPVLFEKRLNSISLIQCEGLAVFRSLGILRDLLREQD